MIRRRRMDTSKFFIFTEGENTERIYFESDIFRGRKTVTVNPKRGRRRGTSPKSLKEWVAECIDDGTIREDDTVWIVLDRDDNRGEDKTSRLLELKQWCESNGVRIAFSNPCFENWYVLHFGLYTTGMTKEWLNAKLGDLLGGTYDKSKDYSGILSPRFEAAVRNARKQREGVEGQDFEHNPYTDVDLLAVMAMEFVNGRRARGLC